MFEPSDKPRLFALPCGVDFGEELALGLIERMKSRPPEDMARVEVIVNTLRMQRRVTRAFESHGARLLPKLRLITSIVPAPDARGDAPTPLGQKLEFLAMVRRLIDGRPDIAPRSSAFDLADSIAALFAEMAEEGVALDALDSIDTSDQSGHWERARSFLRIAADFIDERDNDLPNTRAATEALIASWHDNPPQHPIVIAGSTGSRGPARLLMNAAATLPQGAVVLPGVDTEMPEHGWTALRDAEVREDHPQFRILSVADDLTHQPQDIPLWRQVDAPSPERNKLVSLALRPAPVTHAWRAEGPALADLEQATDNVTMIEAQSLREEALAIALRLRQAAEEHTTAALISPDRTLTRLVTALLDRWNIKPDDSGGIPLHLTAPGRFLRHVAELGAQRLTGESLLILLKHPLCHSGEGRNDHLRHTRDLELELRENGPPFPTAHSISEFAAAVKAENWGAWLIECLFGLEEGPEEAALETHANRLLSQAEALARGHIAEEGSGLLWSGFQGNSARIVTDSFLEAASHGPAMMAPDFATLFSALLSREQQRERDAGRDNIRIWGTLEARVMDADLLILGGLNEGSWPEAPSPDPWLNRSMRKQVDLLLPERRIGLSAHDFQQAVAGKTVWLTRAVRNDGAETVPSRWVNRLTNLLNGLDKGRPALEAMVDRGQHWINLARAFEKVEPLPADLRPSRPSPRPPTEAKPKKLSVTQIKTLVRDPYAIYAREILGLKPLEPLTKTPDPATRGTVLHDVMETFIQGTSLTPDALLSTAAMVLNERVPWPETRALWQARMGRIADRFIEAEHNRQNLAKPTAFEIYGKSTIPHLDFTLSAKADRVDMREDGAFLLYDYKTGHVPTVSEQRHFDKQLLLMAAMAEAGAFVELPAGLVAKAQFLGLGDKLEEVDAPIVEISPAQTWEEFEGLIDAMQDAAFGFTSRRAMQREDHAGVYDHLARFGEWDTSVLPEPEDLT